MSKVLRKNKTDQKPRKYERRKKKAKIIQEISSPENSEKENTLESGLWKDSFDRLFDDDPRPRRCRPIRVSYNQDSSFEPSIHKKDQKNERKKPFNLDKNLAKILPKTKVKVYNKKGVAGKKRNLNVAAVKSSISSTPVHSTKNVNNLIGCCFSPIEQPLLRSFTESIKARWSFNSEYLKSQNNIESGLAKSNHSLLNIVQEQQKSAQNHSLWTKIKSNFQDLDNSKCSSLNASKNLSKCTQTSLDRIFELQEYPVNSNSSYKTKRQLSVELTESKNYESKILDIDNSLISSITIEDLTKFELSTSLNIQNISNVSGENTEKINLSSYKLIPLTNQDDNEDIDSYKENVSNSNSVKSHCLEIVNLSTRENNPHYLELIKNVTKRNKTLQFNDKRDKDKYLSDLSVVSQESFTQPPETSKLQSKNSRSLTTRNCLVLLEKHKRKISRNKTKEVKGILKRKRKKENVEMQNLTNSLISNSLNISSDDWNLIDSGTKVSCKNLSERKSTIQSANNSASCFIPEISTISSLNDNQSKSASCGAMIDLTESVQENQLVCNSLMSNNLSRINNLSEQPNTMRLMEKTKIIIDSVEIDKSRNSLNETKLVTQERCDSLNLKVSLNKINQIIPNPIETVQPRIEIPAGKWRRTLSNWKRNQTLEYNQTLRVSSIVFNRQTNINSAITEECDSLDIQKPNRLTKSKALLLEPTDDESTNFKTCSLLNTFAKSKVQETFVSNRKQKCLLTEKLPEFIEIEEDLNDQQLQQQEELQDDRKSYASNRNNQTRYQHQLSAPASAVRQLCGQNLSRRRRTSVIKSVDELDKYTSVLSSSNFIGSDGDYHIKDCNFIKSLLIDEEERNLLLCPSLDVSIRSLLSPREIVLRQCDQNDPYEFSTVYSATELQHCRKIGEGVYGEVYMNKNRKGEAIVLKIIPIGGTTEINGEQQKNFEQILPEIIIANELSRLRNDSNLMTSGFVEVKNVNCVQGRYPEHLIDLWELYRDNYGTENDHPEIFQDDQIFIVLELANGGQDLEAFQFQNAQQSFSAFLQATLSLAVAEKKYKFEHRDLHWGNILIAPTDDKEIHFKIDDKTVKIPTYGVKATIIDYTLSRMNFEGCCLYNDLSNDNELFAASGDYQFDIYRLMKKTLGNQWEKYDPYTNILWLHYALDKMISGARYRCSKTKKHRSAIQSMMDLRDEFLDFKSASDYVQCLN